MRFHNFGTFHTFVLLRSFSSVVVTFVHLRMPKSRELLVTLAYIIGYEYRRVVGQKIVRTHSAIIRGSERWVLPTEIADILPKVCQQSRQSELRCLQIQEQKSNRKKSCRIAYNYETHFFWDSGYRGTIITKVFSVTKIECVMFIFVLKIEIHEDTKKGGKMVYLIMPSYH